jgi:hypothetical protein
VLSLVSPTPVDQPTPRNLRAYAFCDQAGHRFSVIAADFGEACTVAVEALGGERPTYLGINQSLPGVRRGDRP